MSATFRAQEIVDIIEPGNYPYPLQFFPHEVPPNRRIYPYVEVVNVRPEGKRQFFDVTEETNTFEVRILIRYNQAEEIEIEDLSTIEKQVLSLLLNATLVDKLITFASKEWQRSEIRDNPNSVYGRQSTLTVSLTEKKSTSGLSALGGEMTLSLPGLSAMKLLNKPVERETETNEDIYSTARQRVALAPVNDTHSFFAEVEYTQARMDQIRALKHARSVFSATLSRPGLADETINGKIVQISNDASFDSIETITIQIERL